MPSSSGAENPLPTAGRAYGLCSGNSSILGSRCSKADSYHSPVLTPVRWHDKGLEEIEYGVILPPKFLYHYFVTFSKMASLAPYSKLYEKFIGRISFTFTTYPILMNNPES